MNLGRNGNGTVLEDICFAPLSSESGSKKDVSNCIVQSIWGYFGNDLERLNDTDEDGNFEVSQQINFFLNKNNIYIYYLIFTTGHLLRWFVSVYE